MAKLLVIDNYDSFTYNLVQMFMHYDLHIEVHRSDKITLDQISSSAFDYILISPGPKDPTNAGISTDIVKTFKSKIPILGVCLGMQCINESFGGKTTRAALPMHGKTSIVNHTNQFIFKGVPSPLTAARYHSLVCGPVASELVTTSTSEDNVIMGLSHPTLPVHGVQFHPESFLTQYGIMIIENFLKLGKLKQHLSKNDT
ncbi:MAG: aminodeoxychorismate/anthranilate synthase component II [Desulfobacterales bacterium]|nr:aminodeoxychorismate/anthranilate synthase component II [Desulfobacterales bacterium]